MNEDRKQRISEAEAELNTCLLGWQQREYLPSDADWFYLMNRIAKQHDLELSDNGMNFN